MNDELQELRAEVARLREETTALRADLDRTRRLLGVDLDPDEPWPKMLTLEVASLAVRDPEKPLTIPIHLKAMPDGPHIWLADEKNRTRCEIGVSAEGAFLELRNAAGKVIATLRETPQGNPQLYLATPAGIPVAGMQIKDGTAMLNLVDEKQRALVLVHSNEAGGEIIIGNRNGQPAVTHRAVSAGGISTVHEPGGQVMGALVGTSDHGGLDIRGPQGAMAVAIAANDDGGAVITHDAEGNLVAVFPPPAEGELDD